MAVPPTKPRNRAASPGTPKPATPKPAPEDDERKTVLLLSAVAPYEEPPGEASFELRVAPLRKGPGFRVTVMHNGRAVFRAPADTWRDAFFVGRRILVTLCSPPGEATAVILAMQKAHKEAGGDGG